MNILFFLTPKEEVAYVEDENSLRQAMEKMEYHRYSAIPILNKKGHYVGTLTDGDILWTIKENHLDLQKTEEFYVKDVHLYRSNPSVSINTDIKDLIYKSIQQSFIPVVDDHHIFIGIVRRKEIISFCYKQLSKNNQI